MGSSLILEIPRRTRGNEEALREPSRDVSKQTRAHSWRSVSDDFPSFHFCHLPVSMKLNVKCAVRPALPCSFPVPMRPFLVWRWLNTAQQQHQGKVVKMQIRVFFLKKCIF